jgi:glucuronoarabinoxylan endo-1,4-beta-xylanase
VKKLLPFLALLLCPAAFPQTATVSFGTVNQTIDGFGAASIFLQGNSNLSSNLGLFYGTGSGQLNYSILRVQIPDGAGGSLTGDCSTVNTACAGDVTTINTVLTLNPNVKIFATSLSPPASMKSNGSTTCSGGAGSGSLLAGSYSAYATWLVNYVKSVNPLLTGGATIYAISIQNEPNYCPSYDGALWTAANFDTFIKTNLGPAMASAGLTTLVMFPETSGSSSLASIANTTMTDGSAVGYVGLVATHDYDNAGLTPPTANPITYTTGGKNYWETEVSDFNSFDATMYRGVYVAQQIHAWMTGSNLNAWNFWWLVGLNGDNEGLIDNTSSVTSKATYTIGNWAKFVRPGWSRIGATANPQSGVYITAFKAPTGGQFVVVAINQNGSGTSQTINGLTGVTTLTPWVTSASLNLAAQSSVSVSSGSVTYTLPADSVTTFVGSVASGPLVNVYVSQSGAGAANGTDCADAYAATFFNTSGNWGSGVGQIGAGTEVHLCGTWVNSGANINFLTAQGSGASGNPVTIHFETGAGMQAGTCNSATSPSGCIILSTIASPNSYLTLDGGTPCGWTWATGSEGTCNGYIEDTNSGTSLTQNTSTNAILAEGCTGCEIKNMGIYDMYVQSGGDVNANPQYENCITFSGNGISIHDNQMHDVGWCLWYIEQNGDSNLQVYDNDIYNTPHPTNFSGGGSGTASGAYWYSNHFHDFVNWNTPSCTYHVEGFHADATGAVFNQLYMYNNYIGPNVGACMFAGIFWSAATSMVLNSYAFNNVIDLDNVTANEYAMAITGTGNHLYHNTLVGQNTTFNLGINWADYTGSQSLDMKNNAQQGMYTFMLDDDTGSEGSGITADYNVYSNSSPAHGSCFQAFFTGGTCNWTQYLSNTINGGQEQHSTNTGLLSGGYCCSGTLGLTSAYVPTTGSAVIGAGTNLYSICNGQPIPGLGALCYDALGNARPTSGAVDAGAINHGSTPPTPPTAPFVIVPLSITVIHVPTPAVIPPLPNWTNNGRISPLSMPPVAVGVPVYQQFIATGCDNVLNSLTCQCVMVGTPPTGLKLSTGLPQYPNCLLSGTVPPNIYSATATIVPFSIGAEHQ